MNRGNRIEGSRALVLAALSALTLGGLTAGKAQAAIINYGTYQLHNHPDGNQRPPFYGLRLDELYNATGGHDVFTWDFDHDDGVNQSAMFLTYEPTMRGERIRIFGTSWGGRDGGVAYDGVYDGLW